MKFRLVCCLSIVAPLAASCGDSSNTPDGGTGPMGNVVMRDVNSYTSVSSLTIPIVQTASGVDLEVCWGGITKDILCHDVSATADINNVGFLQIPMSKDVVSGRLAKGTLSQNDVTIYREFRTNGAATCANLSSFFWGQSLVPATDYVAATNKTYMLLFSTGTTAGTGARTMLFLDPATTSTSTMVAAPASSCDTLSFQADLTTPTRLSIPMNGEWVVDWSQITKDSMGNKVTFQLIDSLMLGYYEGKTVTDLEMMFTDVDMIATTLWSVDVPTGQRHMDLKNAKTSTGAAFAGFTGNGIYAVALLCSSCQVPAPVAMSILEPAP